MTPAEQLEFFQTTAACAFSGLVLALMVAAYLGYELAVYRAEALRARVETAYLLKLVGTYEEIDETQAKAVRALRRRALNP